MKQKIAHLIGMSSNNYEMLLLNNFFIWCDLNAYDNSEVQLLLNNKILFEWWMFEYAELENDFLTQIKPYQTVTSAKDLRKVYAGNTIKIGKIYPKHLLYEIRKQARKNRNTKTHKIDRASFN